MLIGRDHAGVGDFYGLFEAQEIFDRIPMTNAGTATAHLFIVNPLRGGGILKLFSTHPPTEERVARLEMIARGPIS